MSQPYPQVEVSVVVIADDEGRILLDFNDNWGSYTLPMSKRHELPPAVEHGTTVAETTLAAATRAAAEMMGCPLDPKMLVPLNLEVPPYNQSSRDGQWKRYQYHVYLLKTTAEPQPVHGHTGVWMTRLECDTLEPISPTARNILALL